jgi:hypothetical protein
MLLRSGNFMVGDNRGKARQVSMKLMTSLAPARAGVEAGVVAKADHQIKPHLVFDNEN